MALGFLLLQLLFQAPFLQVHADVAPGDVVCRYYSTTDSQVNYYTCRRLAETYRITFETFLQLNPSMDKDCNSVKPNTDYCVSGWIQQVVSEDGYCGPKHGNTTCFDTDKPCCNAKTWQCGDTDDDCLPGTCFEGECSVDNPLDYSFDGKCGPQNGNKLCGGGWGSCCSTLGQCGDGDAFCGLGSCYSGNCTIPGPGQIGSGSPVTSSLAPTATPGSISPDGSCGGASRFTCSGSTYGDCCSSSDFCGSTSGHCDAGCQTAFGNCKNPNLSPDGTCGGTKGYLCKGSGYGDCCSSSNFCGSTTGHCTSGCQSAFGTCTAPDMSPDGTCGGTKKYKCQGSSFGDCCSSSGFCGKDSDHCGVGCQTGFGTCSSVSVTTTSKQPTQTGISTDGSCGGSQGLKCNGSTFGNCCSSSGYCGSTVLHCAQGCQKSFSSGCLTSNIPSLDGSCGASKGFTCVGGPFDGQCCSSTGFCGTTDGHCKTGCQKQYGTCK